MNAEFGKFHGQFRTSGWLAVDLLFVSRGMSWRTLTKHDGRAVLFAVAELLVISGNLASDRYDSSDYCFPVSRIMSLACKVSLQVQMRRLQVMTVRSE